MATQLQIPYFAIGDQVSVTAVPQAWHAQRGDIWEPAAEIATASRFIGVNSGPMHIANCYPRVTKRIVLMEFSQGYLARENDVAFPWRAGCTRNFLTSWLDPANTYFNRFDQDYGISFSYLKI